MRITLTGADGFVGRHFTRLATSRGHEVTGVVRSDSSTIPTELSDVVYCDLTERWPELPQSDAVLHLAGLAAVQPSFNEAQRYIEHNAAMVVRMCEAFLRGGRAPRVVVASSGALYAPSSEPVSETSPIAFTSPYVISKVLVENLLSYYNRRGLECIAVRPFNHIGPGQSPGFLVPDLFARVGQLQPEDAFETGNLSTKRDYTDVRDVAMAYVMMCEAARLERRLYNVASGVAKSGEEVLQAVCATLGRPVPRARSIDPELLRPVENSIVVGDANLIRSELGWKPQVPFSHSIRDFLLESAESEKS